MNSEDIISSGLLEMYVTGDASPAERTQVERWRAEYTEVDAELNSIEAAMEAYAMAHAVVPADAVKEKIMSAISSPVTENISAASTAKVVSMGSGWKYAAAAAVILLLVSSAFNFVFYNKYQDADKAGKEAQNQIASLQNDMGGMKNDMNIIQSKYSKPVSLDGLAETPDAGAKIYWMKNTGEVYIDPSNMPTAPNGMQYQLWAIVDGKPVDGGMITTKDGKFTIQKMKTFGKAQAFAITLEKADIHHEQPEGKMYVMGNI